MSRGPSYEDVRNAFFEILKDGGNPSFEAIYAKIGRRGGNDVVRRLIKEIKIEAAQLHEKLVLARAPGVPEALVDIVNEFMRASWELAMDASQENLQQERTALKEKETALNEENAVLRVTADDSAQKVLMLQMQLAGVERERDEREERIRAQSEELERISTRCEELHTQIALFQRRIGELESSVQAERQRGEHALLTATQRYEETLEALTTKNQQVIADLRIEFDRQMSLAEERANGERKHLMVRTDELRQEFNLKEQELKQAVDDAKLSARKIRSDAVIAQTEIVRLKEQLAAANARASTLESITAMLQEQFAKNSKSKEGDDGL